MFWWWRHPGAIRSERRAIGSRPRFYRFGLRQASLQNDRIKKTPRRLLLSQEPRSARLLSGDLDFHADAAVIEAESRGQMRRIPFRDAAKRHRDARVRMPHLVWHAFHLGVQPVPFLVDHLGEEVHGTIVLHHHDALTAGWSDTDGPVRPAMLLEIAEVVGHDRPEPVLFLVSAARTWPNDLHLSPPDVQFHRLSSCLVQQKYNTNRMCCQVRAIPLLYLLSFRPSERLASEWRNLTAEILRRATRRGLLRMTLFMLSAAELRKKYLDFFKEKGHAIIPSASLIPENDPTVLFTTAGMHPLVPYLLGEKHPGGTRLANVQKCIRTGDIEEVGDDVHLTFFEMLGNWSLGDYFKKEAIEWSFEFLTSKKWLGIPLEKLAVSVFAGDTNAPRDEESAKLWQSLGIPKERIAYLPKENNWWGPAGQTGPCGPDTEMFYWSSDEKPPKKFDPDDKQWVEIWNDVFMEYDKQADDSFKPLKQKNVDTGMGLDRVVAVLSGEKSPFETDLFLPILHKIEELAGKNYTDDPKTRWFMRVIADHLRTAVFILGDQRGVTPSNVDQGYVLRRLIRRSIMHAKKLGIAELSTSDIGAIVVKEYKDAYSELGENVGRIQEELQKEELLIIWMENRSLILEFSI